jgi:hypothetical protein
LIALNGVIVTTACNNVITFEIRHKRWWVSIATPLRRMSLT